MVTEPEGAVFLEVTVGRDDGEKGFEVSRRKTSGDKSALPLNFALTVHTRTWHISRVQGASEQTSEDAFGILPSLALLHCPLALL